MLSDSTVSISGLKVLLYSSGLGADNKIIRALLLLLLLLLLLF
jgi:hypothetical protein